MIVIWISISLIVILVMRLIAILIMNYIRNFGSYRAFLVMKTRPLNLFRSLKTLEGTIIINNNIIIIIIITSCVDFVLKQFEDRPYPSTYIKQASEIRLRTLLNTVNNTNNAKAINANDDTYMGCKFLTSSQLFSLQLQDPQLRLQIIAQLLFMVRYLKFSPISLGSSSSSKSKAGKAEIEREEEELRIYLNSLDKRLFDLALATPYGKEFDGLIRKMLQREGNWLTWKALSCPEFEKKEKQIDVSNNNSSVKTPTPITTKEYSVTIAQDDVTATAKTLFTSPDFWEYIESYELADDPEQGIEDQYHPKHNPLFCWRGRRLMADRYLKVFSNMLDGNIGRGLKSIKGINNDGDGDNDGNHLKKDSEKNAIDDKKPDDATNAENIDNGKDDVNVTNECKEDNTSENNIDDIADMDPIDNIDTNNDEANDDIVDVEDGEVEDAHEDKKRKLE